MQKPQFLQRRAGAWGGPLAIPLLAGVAAAQLIADTACDSDENRAGCLEKGLNAAIPNRSNRTDPAPFDEEQHEALPPAGHPPRKNARLFLGFLAHRRGVGLVTLSTRAQASVLSC